jgi:hypothetical protein
MDGPARDIPPARRTGPALADPFPADDPLPGAYELHLPSDNVTIWYTVATGRRATGSCEPHLAVKSERHEGMEASGLPRAHMITIRCQPGYLRIAG